MEKFILYNTATRQKEELKTIKKGLVGMYCCGPTVYSSPHIGNMYAYIVWDSLVRSLEYLGYEVHQVINITDVGHLVNDSDDGEDKMEKGSRKDNISAWDLAKKYEKEFVDNLELLNIKKPWKMPRATEHIAEQIELIKLIEKNGFSYQTSDGIYFDTAKFVGYGDFAKLDIEKIKEGARVEVNNEKKNPTDFALWKFSPKNEKRQMEWESPWGIGFPGWHIECTAMSTKYLGNPFDIHTGGEDHISIHHTNEIAQGHGAFGKQTANYWMHNAFITFNGEKISKSSGGLYTVFDLKEMGYDPLAYRYMVLSSHYRKGMSFSMETLKAATVALNKLREFSVGDTGKMIPEYLNEFQRLVANDLAMPEVMALIWKMIADKNYSTNDIRFTLLDFDRVLGFGLGVKIKEEIPKEIEKLAKLRFEAKAQKNWAESDRLRDEIKEKGYIIEDQPEGYKLKKYL
ncbi:MAG TPA: cysteine--tRNA ligase [Candidatus Woesebacteria bacterium]|nr:cysteine--tRNA ligase [Candidatus Woesebacteria bacterium]